MKKLTAFIGFGMLPLLISGCALPVGEDSIITRGNGASIAYVTDYNLETYVPIPYVGESPVFQVTHRGDLEVNVLWQEAGGNALVPLSTFTPGTIYEAEITITPKNRYIFYASQDFVYRTGRVGDQADDMGQSTRTVTVTYKEARERPESEGMNLYTKW